MLTPTLILSQVQSKKIGLFLPVSRYKIYLETISMKLSPHFFWVFKYDTNSDKKEETISQEGRAKCNWVWSTLTGTEAASKKHEAPLINYSPFIAPIIIEVG